MSLLLPVAESFARLITHLSIWGNALVSFRAQDVLMSLFHQYAADLYVTARDWTNLSEVSSMLGSGNGCGRLVGRLSGLEGALRNICIMQFLVEQKNVCWHCCFDPVEGRITCL